MKPHTGYQHEAFLYRGEDEFLAGTVPFIQDAVALAQPVLVALSEPKIQLLRPHLGADVARRAHFADVTQEGRNPARLIPALLRFIAELPDPSVPIRALGEPIWPGRRPEEIAECHLHEALLNLAVDPDAPVWIRCLYDRAALDPQVIDEVGRSHPALVEGAFRGSTSYGGLHQVDSIFRSELPPAPAAASVLPFASMDAPGADANGADLDGDLDDVRRQVTRCAIEAGLNADRSRALTDALAAIAAQSVRHGGDSLLRTWTDDGALRCEISDRSRINDQLIGRRLPALDDLTGDRSAAAGLRLANETCDLVQVRSTDRGTTIRISTWL